MYPIRGSPDPGLRVWVPSPGMTTRGGEAIELSHRFLKEIKGRFQVNYGASGERVNADTTRDFEGMLRDTMDNYARIDARGAQSTAIQEELGATRGIMHQNIESVLERGAKIETLVEQTGALSQSSNKFHRKAKEMKRSFWCGPSPRRKLSLGQHAA